MVDLLDNEIYPGDKIVFNTAFCEHKDLDYGIVEKLSKDKKSCWCKSFKHDNYPSVLRRTNQIVKIG